MKLQKLRKEVKERLRSHKIYINKLLCLIYKRLYEKWNSFSKRKDIKVLYTIKGKMQIKYEIDHQGDTANTAHKQDLIFNI